MFLLSLRGVLTIVTIASIVPLSILLGSLFSFFSFSFLLEQHSIFCQGKADLDDEEKAFQRRSSGFASATVSLLQNLADIPTFFEPRRTCFDV